MIETNQRRDNKNVQELKLIKGSVMIIFKGTM